MSEPTDDRIVERMEIVIGTLLRWGVMASLALVIAGTAMSFATGRYAHATTALTGGTAHPWTFAAIGHALLDWRGPAFIIAGLLLLISTPILRVVVSIVGFAIQRDAAFVAVTAVVLALLIVSFLIGVAHG